MSEPLGDNVVSEAVDRRVAEIVAEVTDRLHSGAPVDVDEHLMRYPELADRLRPLLAALDVLAQFGSSAGSGRPSGSAVDSEAMGATLGDFRIVRQLGKGGMGIVYEAEQISLRRRVALKVLPFASTMDARQLQRFQNEARVAASLHHTNIVSVYFVGSERGVHFYAMQFIDGQPLSEVIRHLQHTEANGRRRPAGGEPHQPADADRSPHTPSPAADLTHWMGNGRRCRDYFRKVAELGIQAAEALDQAHHLGIVHRDIKPGNLLLDVRGNLWVTDFGLAHVQHSEANLTLTGQVVGTPRYMSPEQASAKRLPIDHRTDVYSLGATLYELLTLRPPFTTADRQELLRQIALEEPIPPRRLNKKIAPELETIVFKAMEKEPTSRYASAKDLADDLRCFVEDRPIQARRPSLRQRLRKWTRRHRALTISIAACLLVSLTVLAGSIGWSVADRSARRRAAEEKAEPAFEEAVWLQVQGKYADALYAVVRAEALLEAGGDTEIRRRVRERRKDLKMVLKLEALRQELRPEITADYRADQGYHEVFRELGIDVDVLEPAIAADRIRERSIRTELVVGLDCWAVIRLRMANGQMSGKRLLVLAGMVDTDVWRNRLRDAVLLSDAKTFKELATSEAIGTQPSPSLTLLGNLLKETGAGKEALEFLLRAQKLRPHDVWINHNLATLCMIQLRQPDDALRFAMIAVALRPDRSCMHNTLGGALFLKGQHEDAIAEFREALKLDPKYVYAHYNLGSVLADKGRLDEAIAEYHKALELDPKLAVAHDNLGSALKDKGQVDEAVAEFHKAIELDPKHALAHYNFGNTLYQKGRLDEAITEYHKALELDPKYANAHNNLGSVLADKGRLDEAIAEYHKAIELDSKYAAPHHNLGNALKNKGRVDEAIAEYREAIRLQPNSALAHCNLGRALMQKGAYRQAVDELRRGHQLGSRKPGWKQPSAQWLRSAEIHSDLNARLPVLLEGKEQAKDAGERLILARICQQPHKKLYAASARWYGEAFAVQPALASNNRYNAACAAALAGCGQGRDAADLAEDQRARLRRQALDWLRAELEAFRRLPTKDSEKARSDIVQRLQHWQGNPHLAGVRESKALEKLPEIERTQWQRLWKEVEALRQRAGAPPTDSRIRKGTD